MAFYHPEQKKCDISCLWISSLLVFLIALSSCSDGVKLPAQMSAPGILDHPKESVAIALPRYIIQPGDRLLVKFYYNSQLNQETVVGPDGNITLQLVHEVRAASLTTTDLTNILRKKYLGHLKDPEISVVVTSFDKYKVYVDGEVMTPGMVHMDNGMTILQAISSAGGLKTTGLAEEVIVIRRNSLIKPFVLLVNVENAQNGSDITQNIFLKAHDIIFVPKSTIANVNTWIDMYIRKNIPISFGYTIYQ